MLNIGVISASVRSDDDTRQDTSVAETSRTSPRRSKSLSDRASFVGVLGTKPQNTLMAEIMCQIK